MGFNPESNLDELGYILSHLEKRSDYVIWGGLCAHAHLGIEYSDIDIYAKDSNFLWLTHDDFIKNGWTSTHYELPKGGFRNIYEKGNQQFDIIYSPAATELLFEEVDEIELHGYTLRFITPEWLMITKMGQLSSEGRSKEKMEKDVRTIRLLREKVDYQKVKEIQSRLPPSYWKIGFI